MQDRVDAEDQRVDDSGELTPASVRSKFLLDHAQLRGKAAVLHSLALSVMRGDEDLASSLRLKGEELQAYLLEHMQWEERRILPLVREESGGGIRESAFLEEHHIQRESLASSLLALRDHALPPTKLATHLLEFVAWLERDMAAEENNVLEALDALLSGSSDRPQRRPRGIG